MGVAPYPSPPSPLGQRRCDACRLHHDLQTKGVAPVVFTSSTHRHCARRLHHLNPRVVHSPGHPNVVGVDVHKQVHPVVQAERHLPPWPCAERRPHEQPTARNLGHIPGIKGVAPVVFTTCAAEMRLL